jgi:hypothetical protein
MTKKEQATQYYPAKYKTKIEAVLDMLKGGQTVKQIKSRMLVSDSYIYLAKKQLKEAGGVLELVELAPAPDLVNSPAHYTYGGIETIDFIEAKLTDEEFAGYLKGNVIKYLTRADLKGNPAQDLAKAKWYMDRLA